MDSIVVTGGRELKGTIPIAGAKNACLTLMPATLLSEEPLTLTNAPRLSDIRTMTRLLQSLAIAFGRPLDSATARRLPEPADGESDGRPDDDTASETDVRANVRPADRQLQALGQRDGEQVVPQRGEVLLDTGLADKLEVSELITGCESKRQTTPVIE